MKLKYRLALLYSLLTAVLMLFAFTIVYYFSARYTQEEFFNYLNKRVVLTSQIYLQKDEVTSGIYQQIVNDFSHFLPTEWDTIISRDKINLPVAGEHARVIPPGFLELVDEHGYARTTDHKRQIVGMRYSDNQGVFLVIASAEDVKGILELEHLRKLLLIILLCVSIITFFIGLLYARQALKPINNIIGEVHTIEAASLSKRLAVTGSKDELDQLATTFNKMLSRLEVAFELQHNFISHASHEFHNPLSAILGEIEVVTSRERKIPEYLESLSLIEREAMRLQNLTESLLGLAQTSYSAKAIMKSKVRVDELMLEVTALAEKQNPDLKAEVIMDFIPEEEELLTIEMNEALMRVALVNVVDNAVKFSGNDLVTITIQAADNCVYIRITDKGVGIPETELSNIFEPFFRASNVRTFKGFGIGLPLTQKIIRLHNGEIFVKSLEKQGTEVIIRLPC